MSSMNEMLNSPPSCLSGFKSDLVPSDETDSDYGRIFSLRCRACESEIFRILAFPIIVSDPSDYEGIEPGEILHRPPHRLQCVNCGTVSPLFDARTQGFDGVINDGCCYESGEEGESPIPGQFAVAVTFSYNFDLDELRESADEAGVNPSDLFDGIGIFGQSIESAENIILGYECA